MWLFDRVRQGAVKVLTFFVSVFLFFDTVSHIHAMILRSKQKWFGLDKKDWMYLLISPLTLYRFFTISEEDVFDKEEEKDLYLEMGVEKLLMDERRSSFWVWISGGLLVVVLLFFLIEQGVVF